MNILPLMSLRGGINRLRVKGGADKSSLYDLVNGYVTIDGSIASRQGSAKSYDLPAGTKGLCAFQGSLYVFAASVVGGMPSGVKLCVLPHPTDGTRTIRYIHFAAPFMGRLYVVVEFDNGDVFHYWKPTLDVWQPLHMYNVNAIVSPTTDNGYVYKVSTPVTAQAWQAKHTYQVGDVVVPATQTGWKYTCIEVDGPAPMSGAAEPVWPVADGSLVFEDSFGGNAPGPRPPVDPPIDSGGGRYGNPGGVNLNPRKRTEAQ